MAADSMLASFEKLAGEVKMTVTITPGHVYESGFLEA
jgi:hypothetical protein